MHKKALRPAWVEVSRSNLEYNINNIKKKVGVDREVIGVIKADGYGHGAVEIARILLENGVNTFGVAAISEAIALREAGIENPIIMLGLTPDMYVEAIVEYNLTPVTCSLTNAEAISKAGAKACKVVYGLIAVDSGMGRIGYRPENPQSIEEIKKMAKLPNFKIKGLYSHFAVADEADKTYSKEQERIFLEFHNSLSNEGIDIKLKMLANSAAAMELPSAYLDAVRTGIILYGCYPSDQVSKSEIDIRPLMSVKANIIQLKKIPIGASVSYGRKFIAKRESLIATIALGYADGFPRPYSQVGRVIVNGVFAPLAGNICMDQCMIDVTEVPNVRESDEVIVMGTDGKNTILAEDIAAATGTINYEILCAFGQRLPKIYVD